MDVLGYLNDFVENQPFLVLAFTTGFSGFALGIFAWFRRSRRTENLPAWQQRGWPQERTRRDLLDRVHDEFTVRRAQGLQEEVAAELDLKLQYSQVQPTLVLAPATNKPDEPLPEGTSIIDVYDSPKVRKKLLILGHPGAGKTTILLELATHLAEQAKADGLHPVPVIFECSTWTGKAPKDWLADEMKRAYHLPRDQAARLLEHGEILLLLDGLDELEAGRQKAFIGQLNTLLETTHQFVICSRVAEYARMAEDARLHLHNAVFIQPLQPRSIGKYLDQVKAPHVYEVLTHHPKLMALARSPLTLSMIILCRQNLPRSLPESASEDDYSNRILETYLDNRLAGNGADQPPRQARHWLNWLATQLKGRSRTEFELEDLQPTWLAKPVHYGVAMVALFMIVGAILGGVAAGLGPLTPHGLPPEWRDSVSERLTGGLAIGLLVGLGGALSFHREAFFAGKAGSGKPRSKVIRALAFGLVVGLVVGLAVGLVFGLALGLAVGLAVGLADGLLTWFDSSEVPNITTVELIRAPHWSSLEDWRQFAAGLALGLAVGLAGGLAGGLAVGLVGGLAVGLAGGLAGGLAVGLSALSTQIPKKSTPSQGIKRSGWNGLIFMGGVSPAVGWTLHFASPNLPDLTVGLMLFAYLLFGGLPYTQHYVLRFILARQGYLPFFYVRFLDQMVKRKLLQRIGGSYRFLHLSLRDYCAGLEQEHRR